MLARLSWVGCGNCSCLPSKLIVRAVLSWLRLLLTRFSVIVVCGLWLFISCAKETKVNVCAVVAALTYRKQKQQTDGYDGCCYSVQCGRPSLL